VSSKNDLTGQAGEIDLLYSVSFSDIELKLGGELTCGESIGKNFDVLIVRRKNYSFSTKFSELN
jgi:hypothetical protein